MSVSWTPDKLTKFVVRRSEVAVGKMSRAVRSDAKKLVGRQNAKAGSRPPAPPYRKTGELQRSIITNKPMRIGNKITAMVGPTVTRHGRPYGLFLELGFLLKGITEDDGTFRPIIPHQRQAPRPFMRPAMDKLRGTWTTYWQ